MNNDDHTSSSSNSFLQTLKAIQNKRPTNQFKLKDKKRRQSIIPPTHLPIKLPVMSTMENELENLFDLPLDENETKSQSNTKITSTTEVQKNDEDNNTTSKEKIEDNSNKEEDESESDFDSLILQNFTPFSGEEDVCIWLEITIKKFNRLVIPRNLRFTAIPLLVEGHACNVYIMNRRNIKSFEDFHELLLVHFNKNPIQTIKNVPPENVSSLPSNSNQQVTIMEEKNPFSTSTFNNTYFSGRPPKHHSTTLNTSDAAIQSGEASASESTLFSGKSTTKNNTSNLDDTTNVLRKILLQNLIQNPKTFQGGKDDVIKWLESLEHSFELTHIPDTNKLDLVSYTLRGEALRWFKNNKDTFTSWDVFVSELKKAFTSSYQAELTFKKLETYTQGQNQSIHNFYNEVLKLCKEADPTMSDAAKLRNLLNKTKPSIQFEVRRKKPTSTKEFLEYAKEIEDLYQLSDITIDTINNNTPNTTNSSVSPAATTPTMLNNYKNSYWLNSRSQHWKNMDQHYPYNYNKDRFRPPYQPSSSNSGFRPRSNNFPTTTSTPTSSFQQSSNDPQFRSNQPKPPNNYYNTNKQPNNYQPSNIPIRNTPQSNKLNSLISSNNFTQSTPNQTTETTDYPTLQSSQFEYQDTTSPNF